MYSLPALSFYLQPNMRMSRLIILLRQPEDRTVSEYLHMEQEGGGHMHSMMHTRMLSTCICARRRKLRLRLRLRLGRALNQLTPSPLQPTPGPLQPNPGPLHL